MEEAGVDLKVLRVRMAGIGAELDGDWAQKLNDQLHLDRGTTECAYWHSGYYQALTDVLDLIAKPRSISDTVGISIPRLVAG